jgi:hypothetical protein
MGGTQPQPVQAFDGKEIREMSAMTTPNTQHPRIPNASAAGLFFIIHNSSFNLYNPWEFHSKGVNYTRPILHHLKK